MNQKMNGREPLLDRVLHRVLHRRARGVAFAAMATSVVLCLVALQAGCTRAASQPGSGEPKADATKPNNPMEVQATKYLMDHIKLGEAGQSEMGGSLSVAARVEVDESRVARVGSPVIGRITELEFQEGQEVKRGQLLAVLNSTGLSSAQLEFLKGISQVQLNQRAVARAEQLLNAGVIGSAELRRRESELSQATAELSAARDQLKVLGMPEDAVENLENTRSITSSARVSATMDGIILQRKVAIGQVVQPADILAEICDLSSLWLVADVPEQTAAMLAMGQMVESEITALPGQKIHGKLSYVSATVNPETRTVRARMVLPNPNHKFKPAMLATMVVRDASQRTASIPTAAVIRDGDTEHVFVQIGPNRFVLRPVTLGTEQGGRRMLMNGLRPGERIVVEGAFHLNNERIRLSMQGA